MKQILKRNLILLILPIFLLTGCWQEEPIEDESLLQSEELLQQETPGVILPERLSLPYAPGLTLDPVTCVDGMQQVVSSLICESLFRLNPNLEPEPVLCQTYTYDAATCTYVFTLRSGITFSDGTLLTAKDVKNTLQRARTSQRYGNRLSDVSSISADGNDLTIVLSAPNCGFSALLDIPIVKSGTEDSPIGTGPYFLSSEQSGAWLIANRSWWQETAQPVDRIALVEAGDRDTMLYRFTSHDVQLVTADLTGAVPISATGSFTYLDTNTTILQYLGCNTAKKPLDDAAVRRALSLAIDREHIVSALLSGHGTASEFPVSPVSSLYPAGLVQEQSSLSEALEQVDVGRTLTLIVNQENSFKVSIAQEIASACTAAGIPVNAKVLSWAAYTEALQTGNFDLYYGEVKLPADWDLSSLLETAGTLNYGGWADERTDQLLAAFASASDRATAMNRLCAHLQKQAPILPICFKSTSVLVQSNVLEGLTPTATEAFYNLTDCTVHLK